jgi:hypothetical protein
LTEENQDHLGVSLKNDPEIDRHTDTSTDPNPIAGIRNRSKTAR